MLISKLLNKFRGPKHLRSRESFLLYLREKGIKIGEGTIVFDQYHIQIDISRPELIEIGNNVLLHRGTIIMTHDYASRSFVNKYNDFIPSHGKIKIGNNVWLGENVTIMKNVTIGDNVIIGMGSIVTKSIPSNSVAVGIPAKVICSFDDYYKKRQKEYVNEAIEYAISIYSKGRTPTVDDFYDDYPAFVDGSNYMNYNYPYSKVFNKEQFEKWKINHKAPYNGFEDFMNEVKKHLQNG